MPKKRVGVSLRKPSPAPDRAAPAGERSTAAAPTPIASPAPTPPGVVAYGGGAVALELQPEAVRHEPPPEPVVVEAFVHGAAAALDKAALELPAAQLRALLQRGLEGYRELTLYLPEKLAQELSLHCLEHDLDMSRLVATAIELHLKGAPVPAPEPQRRASDEAAPDGLLSLMARAVLAELGDWVRAVWVARGRGSSRARAAVAAT